MTGGLLEVKDLSVSYRAVRALSGASLEVGNGECVAVLGPNASGKTTLLKAITGLVRTDKGTISLAGRRLEGLPPHHRALLGMAFAPDRGRVAGEMSVRENLLAGAYLCRNSGEVRRRLDGIWEGFPQLRSMESRPAGDLSGGQRQMLVLARALMATPRLLLIDEPFTSLSPGVQTTIIGILAEAKRRGIGILLAEHQLAAVLKVADKVYALGGGRIVYQGSRRDFAQERPLGTIFFQQGEADCQN